MSSSSSKKPSVSSEVASALAAAPIRGTTTNVRRSAAASSRTLSHVPSSSSGRRMPVRIGMRPAGAERRVGDVEVRVQHLAQRPRDRRGGHQQDVRRAAGRLGLERATLVDAEAVLLVHDREREVRERDRLLDERVGPDDDRRPGRWRSPRATFRRASPLSDPVRSVTADPEVLERGRRPCSRAGGRGGPSARAARAWRPASAAAASAQAATAVLPEPTSPWTSRSIGTGRARSSRISPIDVSWSAVSGASWPSLRASDASSATRMSLRRRVSDTSIAAVCARPRARRRATMPSWRASSSSNARRRSAASRASNDVG